MTGSTGRARAAASVSSTDACSESSSRCLIVGNTSASSSCAWAARAAAGRSQRASTHSPPSGVASAPGGARAAKNQVSKRIFTSSGVIQRENGTSSTSAGERDSRLLLELADGRGGVVRVLARVIRAAREDPGAAHEALLRVALNEQDLGTLGRVPQQDQRRGLTRLRDLTGIELLA